MEEVLQYLEMKNHYYEKFYTVTQKFLDQIARNDWTNLDFFVDSRERILNIIRSFDAKISNAVDRAKNPGHTKEADKNVVKKVMDERKKLGDKILELDLQLISAIDDYKNETIRELKKTVETQQQIDAFEKNTPTPKTTSRVGKA
jgi:nucleosome binding factor SPN SPT16 subunit